MCVATIFTRTFGTQLLAKNSNVKESLTQTEAISMQSSLGLITGHLPRKYHEPVLRTGNKVTCLVIARGSTDSRQRTIRVWKFPSLEVLQQWQMCRASRRTRVNKLPAKIFCWPNYSLVKIFHVLYFRRFESTTKIFDGELFQNYGMFVFNTVLLYRYTINNDYMYMV